jgi:hypothetical protein
MVEIRKETLRCGVLLWNLFGRVDEARALIRAGEPVAPGVLGERVR